MNRSTQLVRAAASAAVLAAGVIGAPAALAVWGRSPLPPGKSVTDGLGDVVSGPLDDRALLGLMTVILWALWALFAVGVASELLAGIRTLRTDRDHPIRPPRFGGPLQFVAHRLVASVLMVGATTTVSAPSVVSARPVVVELEQPVPVADTTPLLDVGVVSDPPPSPTDSAPPTPTAPSGDTTVIDVGAGDTAWSLAEQHLGDGLRWSEIFEMNRGRPQPDGETWTDPEHLEPGWQLLVPTTGPTAGAIEDPGEDLATVEPGDHLWAIASEQLAAAWGRRPTEAETRPYWRDLVELNAARRGPEADPSLLHPGEQVALAPVPPDPAAAPVETAPPVPPPEQSPVIPPPAPPAVVEESAPSQPPPTSELEVPATTVPAPTTSAVEPAPTDRPVDSTPATRPESGQTDDGSGDRTDVLRFALPAATVAAVVLTTIGRRRRSRRRSARPGVVTGPRPVEDFETERQLARAAGDVLGQLAYLNRALTMAFGSMPDPPTVGGVVFGADGEITLHLREPSAPVTPFRHHPSDPQLWILDPEDDRSSPLPAGVPVLETLVALGRTDAGEWVFVDLESIGALQLEGDPRAVGRLVRSLVTELALQPLDHLVNLLLVGLKVPELAEQGLMIRPRLDETVVEDLERTARQTVRFLNSNGLPTTTAGRVQGLERDGLLATVLVAGPGSDEVLLGRVAEATVPGGRGVGAVACDPLGPTATRVTVSEDGAAHIPHLGLTARAASLDLRQLERVEQLVNAEPDTVSTPPYAVRTHDAPGTAAAAAVPLEPYEPQTWDYCVRIFADHQVERPDGEVVSFRYGENPDVPNKNTHRGPELIAYLALSPDRAATLQQVRDHLWWSRQIVEATAARLITGTRKVLGGTDYLSQAEGNARVLEQERRQYRLAESVVTDADLLAGALEYASSVAEAHPDAALSALRPHLERLEAEAFRSGHLGKDLAEWAAAKRVVDQVEQPVIEAGLLAARLSAERGPEGLHDALWSLDQALKACPFNEALVRATMEIEARLGNRDGANHRYMALTTELARDELEPEPATIELRRTIMANQYRIG